MFKYSCIGDNTPENREHLEKVGYTDVLEGLDYKPSYILAFCSAFSNIAPDYIEKYAKEVKAINCIGNDKLFQAVTAMREDSDYMQWFADPVGCWHYNPISMDGLRKATLAELQEHFK